MHATLNEPLMRATDVQAILRLVGGAAELWYQPSLQRQFTLDSLCKLMRAKAGICFTWGDVMTGGQTPSADFTAVGLDPTGVAMFEDFIKTGQPHDPVMDVLAAVQGRTITFTRRQAVADADWFRSDHFRQVRKPLGLGPSLYIKIHAQLIDRTTIVMLARESGGEAFTERDASLV